MARLKPVPRKISHNLEVAHYREKDAERHTTTTSQVEAAKVRCMEWDETWMWIKNEHGSTALLYDLQAAIPGDNVDVEPASTEFGTILAGSPPLSLAAGGVVVIEISHPSWIRVMLSAASGVANHARLGVMQKRTG